MPGFNPIMAASQAEASFNLLIEKFRSLPEPVHFTMPVVVGERVIKIPAR